MVGYFAFPPPGLSTAPSASRQSLADEDVNAPPPNPLPKQPQGLAGCWTGVWTGVRVRVRAQRHELEREQVRLGEMEWVRSGGWLRDAFGRKDKARTERLREDIRVIDAEHAALERWDAYEARWRALISATTPVTFTNIPWPVGPSPTSVEDLTSDAVTDFFLAPLRVRTNTVSRKDRIRYSILRWHPDKMSSIVARTVEQDLTAVCTGINGVFHILRSLQDSMPRTGGDIGVV